MLDDINTVLEWIDRLSKKRQRNKEQSDFDGVMLGLYHLGNKGRESVFLSQLEKLSLPKMQILMATERGIAEGKVDDCGWRIGASLWGLTAKGRLYVEALLEEASS